jgi:hypothetical protein
MSLDPLRKQFGHWVNPSPSMGEGLGRGTLGSITPTPGSSPGQALTRPLQGGENAPGEEGSG